MTKMQEDFVESGERPITLKDIERHRLEDARSSNKTKLEAKQNEQLEIEEKLKEMREKAWGERLQDVQKSLGMVGQGMAALALGNRAQKAMKPLGMAAQLLSGASFLALSTVFNSGAKYKGIDRLIEKYRRNESTIADLDKGISKQNADLGLNSDGTPKGTGNTNAEPGTDESRADADRTGPTDRVGVHVAAPAPAA